MFSNQIVTGLAWDNTTNKMFVCAASFAALFTVDLNTGNLTFVTGIQGSNGAIDIAINRNGVMYSWDIFTDNLYTIDKITGIATLIGPLGINILSQQGGCFDPETDSLFLAACIVPENYGALYRCNTSTGAATFIGTFGTEPTEVDAFVIPGKRPTSVSAFTSPIPGEYSLEQNFPNPFNPNTIINYELRVANFISLKVYDVLGIEVANLVNEKQNAGSYKVKFDGSGLSGGVYFYRLQAGNFIQTRKMTFIK